MFLQCVTRRIVAITLQTCAWLSLPADDFVTFEKKNTRITVRHVMTDARLVDANLILLTHDTDLQWFQYVIYERQ